MNYKMKIILKKCLLIFGVSASILIFGDLLITFLKAFHQLEPELCASISGAILSIITGVTSICVTQSQIKNRALKVSLSQKKSAIYRKLLEHIYQQEQSNIPKEKFISSQKATHHNLLLWGSPKVISAYTSYFELSQGSSQKKYILESLYLAIRLDLGIKNSNILHEDTLKLITSS